MLKQKRKEISPSEDIRRLILETQSFTKTAEILGVSTQRVKQIADRMGLRYRIVEEVPTPESKN
jgi:transposase-like protein